jgi:hypothetical protein
MAPNAQLSHDLATTVGCQDRLMTLFQSDLILLSNNLPTHRVCKKVDKRKGNHIV